MPYKRSTAKSCLKNSKYAVTKPIDPLNTRFQRILKGLNELNIGNNNSSRDMTF